MQNISPILLPFLHILVWLYQTLGNNLGWAIIAFTTILRVALFPFSASTIKTQKKMQSIKPHLDKIKELHGADAKKVQEEQMKLYKESGINPLAGCLPMVLQIGILLVLNSAFSILIHSQDLFGVKIQTMFYGMNLIKPDATRILPIIAAISQVVLTLMMLPIPTPKKKDAKVDLSSQTADMMQKQMLFIAPVMTIVAGVSFASGLVLYWTTSTLLTLLQQYILAGSGSLSFYAKATVVVLKKGPAGIVETVKNGVLGFAASLSETAQEKPKEGQLKELSAALLSAEKKAQKTGSRKPKIRFQSKKRGK